MTKEEKEHIEPEHIEPEESENLEPEMITIEKSEWDKINAELEEYKDKNLRLLAESENTRKRLQKEKTEMLIYAKENICCEFLNPIDHFEKALGFKESLSDELKNWMMGFEMILSQFKHVLVQNDIHPIESVGKVFDPYFHEAIETEVTDKHPENTIIQEYVKGYKMGERIMRPAKVKVAKAKLPETKSSQESKNSKEEIINQKEG